MKYLDNFKLGVEQEDFQTVSENIHQGIYFRGTNLWILIFAIFIASLGLNINSTAVIIGAMLISPLMGPIIGLGFGMATNDVVLLKKSVSSYFFATIVSLSTSTLYFVLSPLNDAHSEILARTSPNIYDVLIALFGGLAGMLAVSSKLKGNVIPGVAIATALMPPLCTAGYGLATLQFNYFFGASYLYIINSVFIALATLFTSRFLKFPILHLLKKEDVLKAKRLIWAVTLITILPSVYLGYNMISQNKFQFTANQFIDYEAIFPNAYLLKREIDPKKKLITLVYGGDLIDEEDIKLLREKLPNYNIDTSSLVISQGFTYINQNNESDKNQLLTQAVSEKIKQIEMLQSKIDSLNMQNKLSEQIYSELKVQYPFIQSSILQTAVINTDSTRKSARIAIIHSKLKWKTKDKETIENWLKVRINDKLLQVYFE